MPTAFLNFTNFIFFKKLNITLFFFFKKIDQEETALFNEIILHLMVGFRVAVWIWKRLFSLGSGF